VTEVTILLDRRDLSIVMIDPATVEGGSALSVSLTHRTVNPSKGATGLVRYVFDLDDQDRLLAAGPLDRDDRHALLKLKNRLDQLNGRN